jgi:hypothetical protein
MITLRNFTGETAGINETNGSDVEMGDAHEDTRPGGEATGHAQRRPKTRMITDTEEVSDETEDDEEDTESPGEETAETLKGKAKGKAKGKGKGKGQAKAEGMGKGKAKAKGKETGPGKGKAQALVTAGDQGGQQGADDSDVDEYHAPTAELEHMDGICARALFTYARINLFQPPAKIVFGEWNKRPAVESKARELAKSIIEQRFRPFASDSLLPLIIDKTAIEPNSIYTTPNVEDAPMLQLTETSVRNGVQLPLGGGRHRLRAAQIIKEMAEEKVKTYQEDIEELKKKAAKAKEGSVLAESLAKRIRMREVQIKMERDIQAKIAIWGIAVYDQGA